MPGDYTRLTFDPREDHIGVLMQQGKVLLDADYNELVEILERRIRVGSLDTYSRCVVPRVTPEGFRIQIAGGMLTIGPGRIYVDGMLAENHGQPPVEWRPNVAEQVGTQPVPYDEQPYLPNAMNVAPPPREGGPHLVYVDVWQRELTYLEERDLLEKAVGVDTATRLQTVWQVKVLPNVGQDVTCATPDEAIEGWADLTAPSAGRLTTRAVGVPLDTDPCVVSPAGGYRGTENRLYRVEIHDPGPLGTATFKWSRDNASIAAAVTAVNAGRDRLTVSRTARDAVLRFSPGDWVEVTDDWHELGGLPGVMRKVLAVDDVAQTITLAAALPAGEFDAADPGARHTRVRRWDQKGLVRDAANNVVADVDASGGVIPVPAAGTTIVLEAGIQIEFGADPAGGTMRTADYWVFAARTVDASIEELTDAPPRGIHHHYCRLALVTFPSDVIDCRTFWPPEVGGRGCDCTACVSAESHNSGSFTLQMAVERVKAAGGGKICLEAGLYNLGETPLQISGAASLRIEGKGWRTMLVYAGGSGAAVRVSGSVGVEIDSLSVLTFGTANRPNFPVDIQNSALVRVERCMLLAFGMDRAITEPGIGFAGLLVQAFFRENIIFGAHGIGSRALRPGTDRPRDDAPLYAATLGLHIEDNLILAGETGVSLEGLTFHLGETRVAGNEAYGCRQAAVLAGGWVLPVSRMDVTGNICGVSGNGIVVGVDSARISNNDIGPVPGTAQEGPPAGGDGIALVQGVQPEAIDFCQVLENRITRLGGHGIVLRTAIGSAMIKHNVVSGMGGSGIVMEAGGQADVLSVENNQVLNVGLALDRAEPPAGIRLFLARDADVAGNTVSGVGLAAERSFSRGGIELIACESARLAGNEVADIGPFGDFAGGATGIAVLGPFRRLDLADNSVRRMRRAPDKVDNGLWLAVLIAQPRPRPEVPVVQPPTGVSLFPVAAAEALSAVVVVRPTRLLVLPRGRELVGVRGNLLEAFGRGPVLHADVGGPVQCGENRMIHSPADVAGAAPPPIAFIRGAAAIVSANYLERPNRFEQFPALVIEVGSGPFTILGNIVTGETRVNGAPLPPNSPWRPLNVQV